MDHHGSNGRSRLTSSEHYATKSELVEIKAVLPHLATKADLAAFQVATREDIAALQVSTKADLAAFQAATQEDMAALRSDMTALESNIQTSIKTGIAAAKSDMERALRNTILILAGVMMAGYAASDGVP